MLSGINEKKHRINILDVIYPVGSVYLSVNATNPSTIMGGTWEEISQGRVLQGVADGETGGDTKEAGLPNITGRHRSYSEFNKNNSDFWSGGVALGGAHWWSAELEASEAFGTTTNIASGSYDAIRSVRFDASKGETKTDGL